MKKNLLLIFFSSCFCIGASAQGTWTQKATFPGLNREWPVAFSIGNYGYVGTGWDSTNCCNNPLTQFWQYDPTLDVWTQKADFGGVARATAVGFAIGNKGYIGTGGWQINLDDFWEYDPGTNAWTQKATFAGGARSVAVGFGIGNFGYIGTGATNSGSAYDMWQYNPVTDTWVQKASIPVAIGIQEAGCFVIGTDAYIVGGFSNTVWAYHSLSDTWTAKAPYPGGTGVDALGFAVCDKGYFGMGQGNYNDIWQYDTLTNTWLQKANFGGAGRDELIAFTIGNKAYLGLGGETPPKHNDLWEFSPDSTCGSALAANFNCSDTSFCSETGMCINFFDHSTGNPTSWHWIFTGGSPDTSNLQNPDSICYTTPGTYPVTLIVSNGTLTDTLAVSPLIIFGSAPAPPTITVAGGDTLYSSHAASYQWYLNGSPIAGATDSFYVAHQGGTYSVQIGDGIGCSSISNGVFITGIYSSVSNGLELQIYPNPASEAAVISWQPVIKGVMAVTVVNVLGEKVYDEVIESGNSKQVTINCKSFASGIYFVKVANENMNWVCKFVKE